MGYCVDVVYKCVAGDRLSFCPPIGYLSSPPRQVGSINQKIALSTMTQLLFPRLRRLTLLLTAIPLLPGAVAGLACVWVGRCWLLLVLLFAHRLLVGAANGISLAVVPLYISELAPRRARGVISSCTQISLGSGKHQRCQPGRNFRPGPQNFFSARPGPARNQCIIKFVLYNCFEILQQNQYNYINLHSHFPLVQILYCPSTTVMYNVQLYQQRLKNFGSRGKHRTKFHT